MWVGSNVDVKPNGVFNSVAFDPSGHPAIAYPGPPDSGSSDQLKYAAFDGAHWNKQTVGTGGGWCTLAFSPAGDPAISHVAWRSSTDTIVMYAALSGGTWHLEPIAYQAGTPSLAFTPAGEPVVSYHDRASATVKYAVFADRAWQHILVDQTGKDQNGMWRGDFTLTSLAISPSGQPAISYFDRHDGGIKCAIGTVTVGGVRGGNWWSRLRDFLAFRTTR